MRIAVGTREFMMKDAQDTAIVRPSFTTWAVFQIAIGCFGRYNINWAPLEIIPKSTRCFVKKVPQYIFHNVYFLYYENSLITLCPTLNYKSNLFNAYVQTLSDLTVKFVI